MRAHDLLTALANAAPNERDALLNARLGLASGVSSAPPGPELVGYHASGIAPIVRLLLEVPVTTDDVLIDLGSGLGKVVLVAHVLTGARARGIELQPGLVEEARRTAARLRVPVDFVRADVRNVSDAFIADGTVFFLYVPFTGSAMADVLDRLHAIASKRSIVVCALGVDLENRVSWLARRSVDSFWLAIYDSDLPAAPRRAARERSTQRDPRAEAIAFERALSERESNRPPG